MAHRQHWFLVGVLAACVLLITSCESSESGAASEAAIFSTLVLRSESGEYSVESDAHLTNWLNVPNEEEPPSPSEWKDFEYRGGTVEVEFSNCDKVDLLQVISYPGGVDSDGMPLSAEYTHICGGSDGRVCEGSSWGDTRQIIREDEMKTALQISHWIALSPICLSEAEGSSFSYIFFLRLTA